MQRDNRFVKEVSPISHENTSVIRVHITTPQIPGQLDVRLYTFYHQVTIGYGPIKLCHVGIHKIDVSVAIQIGNSGVDPLEATSSSLTHKMYDAKLSDGADFQYTYQGKCNENGHQQNNSQNMLHGAIMINNTIDIEFKTLG